MDGAARIFSKMPSRQVKFRLLQLPWEVRHKILQLLLIYDAHFKPLVANDIICRDIKKQSKFLDDIRHMFQVCQQMYRESIDMFYAENVFEIAVEYGPRPGLSIKMMQYERQFENCLYMAFEHANRNPTWLRWHFWNSIDPHFRKVRRFKLSLIEPSDIDEAEDLFIASHVLAPLLCVKDVDINIDDGKWYEINAYTADWLQNRMTALMGALEVLRCRKVSFTCTCIDYFPGKDHKLEEWQQKAYIAWSEEIRRLTAVIEGESTAPNLMEQWAVFIQQPSVLFPDISMKDFHIHVTNSEVMSAAIFRSMKTYDQTGFNQSTQELRNVIDVLFGHLQECDLDEDDCELLHPQYH